jgi:hypothetical protein
MSRPGTLHDSGRGDANDLGIRAAALRVLDYLLRLELTEARWERVDGILATATEAVAAGDLAVLRAATNELRAVGPVRVIRIGGTPVGPPPLRVRERAELMRAAVMAAHDTADDDEENDDDR